MTTGDILQISTAAEFDSAALAVFRHQAAACEPYRQYLSAVGISPEDISRIDQIPYLPIEIFKSHRVYCAESEPETVFTSSGTSASRHHIAHLADYEAVFTRAFELFYGPAADWEIHSLLPCYEERGGSSLVYMVDCLARKGRPDAPNRLLIGVSYALLDLGAEMFARGERLPKGTVVMETGGMKGRREEMSKAQLHKTLRDAFGVSEIHSEYGMCELTSQAYSLGGGRFFAPPWMRVSVRDLVDPFDVHYVASDYPDSRGGPNTSGDAIRGGVNIIDLGNLHSCAFIQTGDVGRVFPDGSFALDGRIAGSDVRGCNLLTE